jgi:hypothetical protein
MYNSLIDSRKGKKMQIEKFTSADAMVKYLKDLTPSDHFKIAKSVGIKPKDKADAHLYADYIVQGVSKGLSGASLVQYAEANVARLQGIMPHLKAKPQTASVAKPATAKVKAPKAPSVAKKAKVKYPDFTIVARPDRGGYEGWYGGKAEAFRDTVEKVHSFFQKKYQQAGQVLA